VPHVTQAEAVLARLAPQSNSDPRDVHVHGYKDAAVMIFGGRRSGGHTPEPTCRTSSTMFPVPPLFSRLKAEMPLDSGTFWLCKRRMHSDRIGLQVEK
jgi:hypothetical protein